MLLVNVRFLCNIVYSRQIVFHALSGIVSAYLLQPLHSETRKTSAVRSDYNVAVGGHNLEIPPVAPELGNRRLRASLAEQKRRISLCGVEMRRINHPGEHLFAVRGLYPALLYLAQSQLVEDVLVLKAKLGSLSGFDID